MSMHAVDESLLLVNHVPLRHGPDGTFVDSQTARGIAQWCRHFDRLTFCGVADGSDSTASSSSTWVNSTEIEGGERCTFVVLPRAYRAGSMLRESRKTIQVLWSAIPRHAHLCFSFGGLIGDWPALAALGAIRQKRPYAAWLDRVETDILINKTARAPAPVRLAVSTLVPIVERYNRFLLRRSSVALLRGGDTFEHYGDVSPNPFCIHNSHLTAEDMIGPDETAQKVTRVLAGGPIKILYVGRANLMKGPFDWLDALFRLREAGIPFSARWIGDGPELEAMRGRVAALELAGQVELPGYQGDRGDLLRAMRESDIFVFCHRTKESPRCLVEALCSGSAIVGYDSAYPRGLVETHGGGCFVPKDDVDELVALIAKLHRDRRELARLVTAAAQNGKQYTEDSIYANRAWLMKQAREV